MYVKIPKITTANNSKSCKTSDVVIAVTPFNTEGITVAALPIKVLYHSLCNL